MIEVSFSQKERGKEVVVEEELRTPEEAGVNRESVRKTSLATPKGNDVRCKTTSPFAGSRHYGKEVMITGAEGNCP